MPPQPPKLTQEQFEGILGFFTAVPSILMMIRIYVDTRRFRKHGYLPSSVVSLGCGALAWFFLLITIAMIFWRTKRIDPLMQRKFLNGEVPLVDALGTPLIEGTVMHSYLIPTGLWLVKASFVAMYYNLKRHLTPRLRLLVHFLVVYLILSYLVLVLSHVFWCGAKNWAITSRSYCTSFTAVGSISLYAVMNISSDLLVMLVPVLMIREMQVRTREKWAVFFLVFLGTATIATTGLCCGLHITYRKRLIVYYGYVQMAEMLAAIELAVAVAAVSLPSLRAVLYRRREEVRRKSAHTYSMSAEKSVGSKARSPSAKNTLFDEESRTGLEDEPYIEDGDTSQLVILRRLSYEVHSAKDAGVPATPAGPQPPLPTHTR